MQVDSRLRAGDVDGPNVTLGKFERTDETSGALVESSEIVATNASNLPWFHVVAGGGTANGGYFHLGNPGDYSGRMTYDGETLSVANWIVDSNALVAPGGYVRMDTDMGIVFVGANEEPTLPRGESMTSSSDPLDYMVTFWRNGISDAWPTHRIHAFERAGTPNEQAISVQAQPLTGDRAYVLVSALGDMQAQVRMRAVGGYDTVNQQMTYIDLWAYRSEGTAPFTHPRIDLSGVVYPMPWTDASAPGGTIKNGCMINSNGTYEPGAGAGLYAYFGGYWKPLALVADGWEALDVSDNGTTAGNVQFYTCSASGGAFTVNLPAATAKPRDWEYTFYKSDSSANAITLDADGAATINGAATYALTKQYQAVTIRRVGANWAVKSTA